MSPRRTTVEQSKGVFEVEWPLFGELSRALALKVVRSYDPELIVGVATAGVVPGAVIAAILDREFHSIVVSRRYQTEAVRETPAVFGEVPAGVLQVGEEGARLEERRHLLAVGPAHGGERHRVRAVLQSRVGEPPDLDRRERGHGW